MKTKKITGDWNAAVEYLVAYLIGTDKYDVLAEWDRLRGNDGVLTTKLSEQKERLLAPYGN